MTQEEGLTGDEYKKMTEEICDCGHPFNRHTHIGRAEGIKVQCHFCPCKKFKAQNHSPQREISDISSPRTPEDTQNHSPLNKPSSTGEDTQNHAEKSLSNEIHVKLGMSVIPTIHVQEAVKRLKGRFKDIDNYKGTDVWEEIDKIMGDFK